MSKNAADSQKESPAPFEKSMERLEAVVAEMESGKLTLDEMAARFEEGTELVKTCSAALSSIEQRIRKVTPEGSEDFKP